MTRRLWKVVFSLVAVGFLLGWLVYQDAAAKHDAMAFCAKANKGAPVEGLATDAVAIGERILRHISSDRVQVGFIGIPPFSRYLCTIEIEADRIKGATVSHID